jgi:TatD family-associated radical SAM protein
MLITYPLKTGLYVNMTNRCSCSCTFCLRNNGKGVYGTDSLWLEREPTVDEVLASIRAWDLSRFKELVFCGYGEPTMRLYDVLEVARRVKEMRPELLVRINTNGLSDLVYGKKTAPLLKGLVDTVSISLNTPDPDEYVRICRPKFGPGSWEAMVEFAKDCTASVPDVVFTVVDEPVTSKEAQERCRAIAASAGARLPVRPCETTTDGPPPPGR